MLLLSFRSHLALLHDLSYLLVFRLLLLVRLGGHRDELVVLLVHELPNAVHNVGDKVVLGLDLLNFRVLDLLLLDFDELALVLDLRLKRGLEG